MQAKQNPTDQGRGIVEKKLMSGRVTEEITEERKEVRKVPRATNLIGSVSRTKEAVETMAKARVGVDLDFLTIAKSK